MSDTEYVLASQRLVMFSDLNFGGRLFGGRLLAWIDETAAMVAMRIMGTKRLVTKKMGEVIFEAPGMLSDNVEIWCRTQKRGRTSLTLECRAQVRDVEQDHVRTICTSTVVYVALDENGRPRPWRTDKDDDANS